MLLVNLEITFPFPELELSNFWWNNIIYIYESKFQIDAYWFAIKKRNNYFNYYRIFRCNYSCNTELFYGTNYIFLLFSFNTLFSRLEYIVYFSKLDDYCIVLHLFRVHRSEKSDKTKQIVQAQHGGSDDLRIVRSSFDDFAVRIYLTQCLGE